MNTELAARLRIIAGALLFSTGGLAIKASTFDGWQVSGLRSGFAVITLLVVLPQTRRGWGWRTWLVAIPYAATFMLFSLGNKFTTAANTIFLQDTASLYLLLLAPLLLGEHFQRRDSWFLVAVLTGMVLFFARVDAPMALAPKPLLGNTLAAISGITWAFTLLGMRWLARRHQGGQPDHPIAAVVLGNLLACLVSVIQAFPMDSGAPQDWLIMIYLGVFQIAFAYLLVTAGMRHLPALETSLILLLEPVLNPIWVWLLLGEIPGTLAIIGGLVILSATTLRTWRQARAA